MKLACDTDTPTRHEGRHGAAMQPTLVRTLAQALIDEYPDLAGWSVEFSDRAIRTLGLCIYRRKVIRLSRPMVELNEPATVADVVRHEIAHARVGPGRGHDRVWKRMARLVGAKPVRCARDVVLPPGRWVALCPTCQRAFFLYRKPKPGLVRWCANCGRQRGLLHFATQLAVPDRTSHESNVGETENQGTCEETPCN
jgi:predicted SprT family Zn-dependent metalloprotease